MDSRVFLAAFWLAWLMATVQAVTGYQGATYTLGLAILSRLFWMEYRD